MNTETQRLTESTEAASVLSALLCASAFNFSGGQLNAVIEAMAVKVWFWRWTALGA
jgi:hypothetical protein